MLHYALISFDFYLLLAHRWIVWRTDFTSYCARYQGIKLSRYQAIKLSSRNLFANISSHFAARENWRRKTTISVSLKPVWNNPYSKTASTWISGLKILGSSLNSPNLQMKITSCLLPEISINTPASNKSANFLKAKFCEDEISRFLGETVCSRSVSQWISKQRN